MLTVNNPATPTVTAAADAAAPGDVPGGRAELPGLRAHPLRLRAGPRAHARLQPVPLPGHRGHDAGIGTGTSDQFQLTHAADRCPRRSSPREGFELEVDLLAQRAGPALQPALLPGRRTSRCPCWCRCWRRPTTRAPQLDRFIQGTDSQLDVLFVVSNTTTMQTYPAAAAGGDARVAGATRSQEGVDLRVGVTTTGLVAAAAACARRRAGR